MADVLESERIQLTLKNVIKQKLEKFIGTKATRTNLQAIILEAIDFFLDRQEVSV